MDINISQIELNNSPEQIRDQLKRKTAEIIVQHLKQPETLQQTKEAIMKHSSVSKLSSYILKEITIIQEKEQPVA